MSPSQTAKHYGLKSLTQVSEISGVSVVTLNNWHKQREKLFHVLLQTRRRMVNGLENFAFDSLKNLKIPNLK